VADRPARLVTLRLVHVVCWLVIAGATAVLAAQLLGDRVGRYVTPLQALTPWLVPFAGVAAVVALGLGQHAAAAAGAGVGLVFLALVTPLAFPASLPRPAGDAQLTIVHANLLYSNPSIDEAIDALLALDADLIALSELTPDFAGAIAASPIGEHYPYTVLRPGEAAVGLGIWSRVPIAPGPVVEGSAMTLTAEVDAFGGEGDEPMVVLLAHPLPPLFDGEHWRQEVTAMERIDDDVRERTVLVADLNVSYYHPPFRRFVDATGWRDVHQALGRGFSVSWPTDATLPPFVRLDHALVGGRVTATAIDDHGVPGGDHRAFAVTVSWAAR
jgi:endonuclease/exonuclease/phosphatase (EEP) superfamily protein YafD